MDHISCWQIMTLSYSYFSSPTLCKQKWTYNSLIKSHTTVDTACFAICFHSNLVDILKRARDRPYPCPAYLLALTSFEICSVQYLIKSIQFHTESNFLLNVLVHLLYFWEMCQSSSLFRLSQTCSCIFLINADILLGKNISKQYLYA
jgi:hypothetical protein